MPTFDLGKPVPTPLGWLHTDDCDDVVKQVTGLTVRRWTPADAGDPTMHGARYNPPTRGSTIHTYYADLVDGRFVAVAVDSSDGTGEYDIFQTEDEAIGWVDERTPD